MNITGSTLSRRQHRPCSVLVAAIATIATVVPVVAPPDVAAATITREVIAAVRLQNAVIAAPAANAPAAPVNPAGVPRPVAQSVADTTSLLSGPLLLVVLLLGMLSFASGCYRTGCAANNPVWGFLLKLITQVAAPPGAAASQAPTRPRRAAAPAQQNSRHRDTTRNSSRAGTPRSAAAHVGRGPHRVRPSEGSAPGRNSSRAATTADSPRLTRHGKAGRTARPI